MLACPSRSLTTLIVVPGRPNKAEDGMSPCASVRLIGGAMVVALPAPAAVGYIHVPPMTLQKMCKTSTHIRVLSVKKYDREKRSIVFEVVENLKGQNQRPMSFRHALRTGAEGFKPILDWVGD